MKRGKASTVVQAVGKRNTTPTVDILKALRQVYIELGWKDLTVAPVNRLRVQDVRNL